MLRYLKRLEDRDIALNRSMIPLGSCTMKLNATAEMMPVTFPGFADIHPFAPAGPGAGLCGAHAAAGPIGSARSPASPPSRCSPTPAARASTPGLLAIRAWHRARGEADRDVCLIPSSAHGTNPASAVMAGMRVVVVACDRDGNVDLADLRAKAEQHAARLAALMVTYPEHARRVRGGDPRDLRAGPRARRPGLHGRRQHERAGGADLAGGDRRRCVPPQPAQDLLHPAWRRRARRRADRRRRASRAAPAEPSAASRAPGRRRATARSAPRPSAAPASCPSPTPISA